MKPPAIGAHRDLGRGSADVDDHHDGAECRAGVEPDDVGRSERVAHERLEDRS